MAKKSKKKAKGRSAPEVLDNLEGAAQPMAIENDLPLAERPMVEEMPYTPEMAYRQGEAPDDNGLTVDSYGRPLRNRRTPTVRQAPAPEYDSADVPAEAAPESPSSSWTPPAWAAQGAVPPRGRGPLLPPGAKPYVPPVDPTKFRGARIATEGTPAPVQPAPRQPASPPAPTGRPGLNHNEVLNLRDSNGRLVYPPESLEYQEAQRQADKEWVANFYAKGGKQMPDDLDYSLERHLIEQESTRDNRTGEMRHKNDGHWEFSENFGSTWVPNTRPAARAPAAPAPRQPAAPAPKTPSTVAQEERPLVKRPSVARAQEIGSPPLLPFPGGNQNERLTPQQKQSEDREYVEGYDRRNGINTRRELGNHGPITDWSAERGAMERARGAAQSKTAEEQRQWDARIAQQRQMQEKEDATFGRLGSIMGENGDGSEGTIYPNSQEMAKANQRQALTPQQRHNRDYRTQLEADRMRTGLDAMIRRMAKASGVSPEEARGMFDAKAQELKLNPKDMSKEDMFKALAPLRDRKAGKRNDDEEARRKAYSSQMMLAGANRGKNEVNLFNTLPQDFQNVVAARRLADTSNTTPMDVQAERSKAEAEANARIKAQETNPTQLAAAEQIRQQMRRETFSSIDGDITTGRARHWGKMTESQKNELRKTLKAKYSDPSLHGYIDSIIDQIPSYGSPAGGGTAPQTQDSPGTYDGYSIGGM